VEKFVADIISAIAANYQRSKDWALREGVIFENYNNSLSDIAENVQSRL